MHNCSELSIDASGRKFSIRIMKFENGAIISVHEGSSPRIGPMVVSVTSSTIPVTTSVIPAKTGSLLLKLVAEMVSVKTGGIAAVTVYAASDIPSDVALSIVSKIREAF